MNGLSLSLAGAVALYALVLNGAWEYAQLRPLYACWERWTPAERLLWPLAATVGDVLIVLGVAGLAAFLTGGTLLAPASPAGWGVLLALSFAASLFFEWIAQRCQLWDYRSAMPTMRLGKETVGLAPVAQITLLPAASLLLAVAFPL